MAMTYGEFQGKLQELVREQGDIARRRYIALLKENDWQTIKDVPEEGRDQFVQYVEHGDLSQAVS